MTTTDGSALPVDRSPAATPERLLERRHLPVVVGVIALVTLAAFENRAVQTVLPVVVRDLDGWGLFGASSGAALVAFTVAVAWSGGWTDRFGPRRVLLSGLAVFVLAQGVSGLAPTMGVFVAGRALSGAAEGLVDTALMVLVAQALPESLRAKVFAGFAAAWILPSVLGPGLAGGIEALAGWRPVFLGPLVVALPALLLLRPALRRTRAAATGADDPGRGRRTRAALALAAGLALVTFAAPLLETGRTRGAGLLVVSLGALLGLVAAERALPPGTARLSPGVPAVVGLRLLTSAAFTGVGMTLPLMLVTVHGASAAQAGLSLTVTGVFWALGSWLSSIGAVQSGVGAAGRVRLGGLLITFGSLGPVLLALDVVGILAGLVGWALAALGMGILSPTLSTQLLALAPAADHGRASAAQGLATSTGVALQTGLVGGVVAWLGPAVDGPAFAALMGLGGVTAALVVAGGGRVASPSGQETRSAPA